MSEEATLLSRVLVGTALQSPDHLTQLLHEIHAEDLDPPYSVCLGVLAKMRGDDEPIKPWAVHNKVAEIYRGLPTQFVADTITYGNPLAFDWYLAKFKEGLTRRGLYDIGLMAPTLSRMEDLAMALQIFDERLANVKRNLITVRSTLHNDNPLWDYEIPPENALFPGIMERQSRVILTGGEGSGKSVLLRQLAIAGALGRHPFKPIGAIEPIRTLYIDLENPGWLVDTCLKDMLCTLRDRRIIPDRASSDGRFAYEAITGGMDIVGRGEDRARLTSWVDQHRPDLLCIGPIYRLAAAGGDLDEATAGRIMDYLNHLRATYDIAIATEAHPPHGATDSNDGNQRRVLRPSGSSAWMRWPEVGRGLRKVESVDHRVTYSLENWRGDRSPRMRFPNHIARAVGEQVWFDDVSEQVSAR